MLLSLRIARCLVLVITTGLCLAFPIAASAGPGGAVNLNRSLSSATAQQVFTAVDDAYSTTVGIPFSVAAPGVTANDNPTTTDTPSLHATLLIQPSHDFMFILNTDGSFSYV